MPMLIVINHMQVAWHSLFTSTKNPSSQNLKRSFKTYSHIFFLSLPQKLQLSVSIVFPAHSSTSLAQFRNRPRNSLIATLIQFHCAHDTTLPNRAELRATINHSWSSLAPTRNNLPADCQFIPHRRLRDLNWSKLRVVFLTRASPHEEGVGF